MLRIHHGHDGVAGRAISEMPSRPHRCGRRACIAPSRWAGTDVDVDVEGTGVLRLHDAYMYSRAACYPGHGCASASAGTAASSPPSHTAASARATRPSRSKTTVDRGQKSDHRQTGAPEAAERPCAGPRGARGARGARRKLARCQSVFLPSRSCNECIASRRAGWRRCSHEAHAPPPPRPSIHAPKFG